LGYTGRSCQKKERRRSMKKGKKRNGRKGGRKGRREEGGGRERKNLKETGNTERKLFCRAMMNTHRDHRIDAT
jgi:hypothetical protein